MKHVLLFENYKKVDSFAILAKRIIEDWYKNHKMSLKRFMKDLNTSHIRSTQIYFEYIDIDDLKRREQSKDFYLFLRSKLLKDLEIRFSILDGNSLGRYITSTNKLYIDISSIVELFEKCDIDTPEFLNLLYDEYSSIIIHEFTHIYDTYMLDGNLYTSKDLKRHKKRMDNSNDNIDNFFTAEVEYYNLSFEIKSHLNQIVYELGDISVYKTFQDLLDKINSIERLNSFYNNLETKNKQKINKILFKLWTSQKE